MPPPPEYSTRDAELAVSVEAIQTLREEITLLRGILEEGRASRPNHDFCIRPPIQYANSNYADIEESSPDANTTTIARSVLSQHHHHHHHHPDNTTTIKASRSLRATTSTTTPTTASPPGPPNNHHSHHHHHHHQDEEDSSIRMVVLAAFVVGLMVTIGMGVMLALVRHNNNK